MDCCLFFFKQETAYEMRISDWSSDVCSSDLVEYTAQPAKPLPNWDYDTNEYVAPTYSNNDNYVAPIDYTTIHLPTQLDTFTAPIQAPEDKIRLGRYIADREDWISKDTADRTNGQTAIRSEEHTSQLQSLMP